MIWIAWFAGIEKEYEQKVLPDGKINIDGFLCLFDVSVVPSRSLEKQVEVVTAILNNLIKTKKPVILVSLSIKYVNNNNNYWFCFVNLNELMPLLGIKQCSKIVLKVQC